MLRRAIIVLLTLGIVLAAGALAQRPTPAEQPKPQGHPTAQPAAALNLMTVEAVNACSAQWRYSDARIVGVPALAPAGTESGSNQPAQSGTTYEIMPRAGAAGFDDSSWPVIAATSLGERRGGGKVSFNWYRITLTMPARVGDFDTAGSTAVLSVTVDDYAEVWVNGELPRALNQPNPNLITGFNTPNRITIARDLKPGTTIEITVFGINGPISAAPENYIWFREANVEFFAADAAAPLN